MEKHKYIRKEDGFIIFPQAFNHSDFGHKSNTISAGFCMIDTELEQCFCFGESISIGIKSKPEDTNDMTIQFFGYKY